jgi:hypothetical protein
MKNLFLHQFLKDLRQTKVLWALWLLFTIIQFALAAWNVSPFNLIDQNFYNQLSVMVPAIQRLILIVLIPALILQEPTVGVNAFWLTRPMPTGTVLGSKLMALIILVLFPTVGQCMVLHAHGIVIQEVLLGGIQIGLQELSWIAVITMLATLSANFTGYIIATVVLYALLITICWLYGILDQKYIQHTDWLIADTIGLLNSRKTAFYLMVVILSFGVTLFQYRTRKIKLSIALAAGSILIASLTVTYWPCDFLSRPAGSTRGIGIEPEKLEITVMQAPGWSDIPDYRAGDMKQGLCLLYSVNMNPDEWVSITPLYSELILSTGEKLESLPLQQRKDQSGIPYFNSTVISGNSLNAALDYLPTVANKDRSRVTEPRAISFFMNAKDFEKYRGMKGKLNIRLKVQRNKYRISSQLPVERGAFTTKGSERVTISDVVKEDQGFKIDIKKRTTRLLLKTNLEDAIGGNKVYALVNYSNGEAIAGRAQNLPNYFKKESILFLNGISDILPFSCDNIENTTIEKLAFGNYKASYYDPDDDNLELPIDMTKEWLAESKLVEIEGIKTAEDKTTVTINDIKIEKEPFYIDSVLIHNINERNKNNLDSYHGIILPENPSRSDIWKYIKEITGINENKFDSQKKAVDLLSKINPKDADELFIMWYNSRDNDLIKTINNMDLSQSKSKKLVFRYLDKCPNLIDSVVKNHWELDLKQVVIEKILKYDDLIEPRWLEAVASLQDPSTYPYLLSYCKQRSSGELIATRGLIPFRSNLRTDNVASVSFKSDEYDCWGPSSINAIRRYDCWDPSSINAIRHLPGNLIAEMVFSIWKDVRGTTNERRFMALASSWGISDALERAAEILSTSPTGTEKNKNLRSAARNAFTSSTVISDRILDSEVSNWYRTNGANLRFDPNLRKFLIHARPSPDKEASWTGVAQYMHGLGDLAGKGDTNAIDKIEDAIVRMTEGLDPVKDEAQIAHIESTANETLQVMSWKVVKDPSLFHVLEYANGKKCLRSTMPMIYSKAVEYGSTDALQALLDYKTHNWTLLDAVHAIKPLIPQYPKAVDFVLEAYNDPATANFPCGKTCMLSAIKEAADAGNEKAIRFYKEIQHK